MNRMHKTHRTHIILIAGSLAVTLLLVVVAVEGSWPASAATDTMVTASADSAPNGSPRRSCTLEPPLGSGGPGLEWEPCRGCWSSEVTFFGPTAPQIDGIGSRTYTHMDNWSAYDPEKQHGAPNGHVYNCYDPECTGDLLACTLVTSFVGLVSVVSPRDLAERAVVLMALHAPQIGMTGGDPPQGMQIVGVPAWMWAADPGPGTTESVTQSAADGGTTVTATARLEKTVWSMGDGITVTCSGTAAAGTPWRYGYGGLPSPTCGHTYTRPSVGMPGGVFTVTVTAYWRADWSGGGQSGVIYRQVDRSIQKRVGEVQSVLVPGPGGRK